MDSRDKEQVEKLVNDAEAKRLEAESAKLEAERFHFDARRREIEKRLNTVWYLRPALIQAVVAGIVAIPLIWFFVTQITVPLLKAEEIQLKLQKAELEQTTKGIEIERNELRIRVTSTEKQIAVLESKLSEYENSISLGKKELREFQDKLVELTKDESLSTQESRASLARLVERAVKKLETLQEFTVFAQTETEAGSDRIISQIPPSTVESFALGSVPGELRSRADIVRFVSREARLSHSRATEAVEAFVAAIATGLSTAKPGDGVQIPGLGTFLVRQRAERTGRNPQTGETIMIAASRSVVFKASKSLRDAVSNN